MGLESKSRSKVPFSKCLINLQRTRAQETYFEWAIPLSLQEQVFTWASKFARSTVEIQISSLKKITALLSCSPKSSQYLKKRYPTVPVRKHYKVAQLALEMRALRNLQPIQKSSSNKRQIIIDLFLQIFPGEFHIYIYFP